MSMSPNETTFRLAVVDIGGSPGLILPDGVLAKLGVSKAGEVIDIIEDADGFAICRHTPNTSAQMDVARGVMSSRREALADLAKGED